MIDVGKMAKLNYQLFVVFGQYSAGIPFGKVSQIFSNDSKSSSTLYELLELLLAYFRKLSLGFVLEFLLDLIRK
jgi:hypothetical protein